MPENPLFTEENFNLLIQNIPIVIYSVNLDGDKFQLFLSEKIFNLTGYKNSEFHDDPELFMTIIHPEDRENVLQKSRESLYSNSPVIIEYRIISKDKTVKWIRNSSNPVTKGDFSVKIIYGFIEEITAQKSAEKELLVSKKKYYDLFENAGDAIYIIETNTLKIIDANKHATEMLGYSREEFHNMTVMDFNNDMEHVKGSTGHGFARQGSLYFRGHTLAQKRSRNPCGNKFHHD